MKFLRPDVKNIMHDDLAILMEFARWISSKSQWAENLGFYELAKGFSLALSEEIDFILRRATWNKWRRLFKTWQYRCESAKVYTRYSNSNVLVMEYVKGKSVTVGMHVYEEQAR